MNTRALALSIWLTAVVLMGGCATSVHLPRAQLPALSSELIEVQEQYLEAHVPRPTGGAVLADAELQRRLSLIIDTWDDYARGRVDAQRTLSSGRPELLAFGPLNDYEQTYIGLLRQDFGIEFVTVDKPVTNVHRRAYIYGYNSTVGQQIEAKHGLNTFVALINTAVRQHTMDKFSYYNPFFIPWRFNEEDAHIIELDRSPAEKPF